MNNPNPKAILNSVLCHIRRANRTRLAITGLAIAALVVIVAIAALNANATPAGFAELRIRGYVNDLKDDALTARRQQAQQNLESLGAAAVPQLTAALRSDNPVQRRNAADMLGYIALPQAASALQEALRNDTVPAVRRTAAWGLGEIKDARGMNDLQQAATADKSASVRGAAADSLARIRTVLAKATGVNEQFIGALVSAPSQNEQVYLAARRDLFVSKDGGKTWTTLSAVLPSQVSALAVNPTNPQELYAGLESMGMYKSTDGGKSWNAINNGLTLTPGAREAVSAIAIDPAAPNLLYIARGVWLGTGQVTFYPIGMMSSRDGGSTWQALSAGSNAEAIAKLVFRDGQLYGLAGDHVLTLVTPR
jgi:hypothetical protein